jgi:hypothetical protein
MKPPVVHDPVQPPRDGVASLREADGDAVSPPGGGAADDGRDVRYASTEGQAPAMVGGFGPLVDAPPPDADGAADEERRAP